MRQRQQSKLRKRRPTPAIIHRLVRAHTLQPRRSPNNHFNSNSSSHNASYRNTSPNITTRINTTRPRTRRVRHRPKGSQVRSIRRRITRRAQRNNSTLMNMNIRVPINRMIRASSRRRKRYSYNYYRNRRNPITYRRRSNTSHRMRPMMIRSIHKPSKGRYPSSRRRRRHSFNRDRLYNPTLSTINTLTNPSKTRTNTSTNRSSRHHYHTAVRRHNSTLRPLQATILNTRNSLRISSSRPSRHRYPNSIGPSSTPTRFSEPHPDNQLNRFTK